MHDNIYMNSTSKAPVAVIGAGLAGSEAALVLAAQGIAVDLYEMRPECMTPAHKTPFPAELICSNSFKSDQLTSAHGVLKAELHLLKSPLLAIAHTVRVPAGSALAVDREQFSRAVMQQLMQHSNISYIRKECRELPQGYRYHIIAAGPLVSAPLAEWITHRFSAQALSFYDAIAPIIAADSIDMNKAFLASRWNKGGDDYCNCPFNSEHEYRVFYDALITADKVKKHSFEQQHFFEACLPIEVIAQRGIESLAYGPLRPVGLINPHTDKRPYAVCQLRKEQLSADSYNMVGFQTRMTIAEQQKVFKLIPGLENAEFLRYGSIHRNTFCNSPRLLSADLSFKQEPSIFLAGQLCGNEGYTESVATGHCAALFVAHRIRGNTITQFPLTTACGALIHYITNSEQKTFTPTNVHFGLFDAAGLPTDKRIKKSQKKQFLAERALQNMKQWIQENDVLA